MMQGASNLKVTIQFSMYLKKCRYSIDPDEEETCDLSKDFAIPNLSQNMLKGTWYIMK